MSVSYNKDGAWRPDGASSVSTFMSDEFLTLTATDILTFAFSRLNDIDPGQEIYIDANDRTLRILAGDVRSKVYQIAAGLSAHGVQAGDCVCIHSFNSIWYPLFWLAIVAVGGVVTGSNPAYTPTELTHHFTITNVKFVVSQSECLAAVKEAVSKCDISMSNVFVLGNNVNGLNGFVSSVSRQKSDIYNSVTFNHGKAQPTSVAVYATTSGTTGLPKAAELSHNYVVAQTSMLEHLFSKRQHEIRQLVCLPIFHAFAAQLAIVLPLRIGIKTYIMPRFTFLDYTHHVEQFHITDCAVVPPIVSALLDAPLESLKSIRYMICAGAPMTASVQTKLYSSLSPTATIAQCWGTTEAGWMTVFDPFERDYTGSVGRLLPGTTLKIIDDHGNSVSKDNIHGEARIKSPSMFTRYRNNSAANSAAFDNEGYYQTGDRVYMRNGKVFIDGRIKDTLKVNGWQVSPEEIEHIILELTEIVDCAVIGHLMTNENGLEETKPRALVVGKPGTNITEVEVQEHVSRRLIRYKRLTGGVVFVEEIPRSNTGKILRRKLVGERGSNMLCNGHHEKHKQLVKESEVEAVDDLRKYFVAMVLVPLLVAMGLPGLILLCIMFRIAATK